MVQIYTQLVELVGQERLQIGLVILFLLVVGRYLFKLFFWLRQGAIASAPDRRKLIQDMTSANYGVRYRATIARALDWFALRLGDGARGADGSVPHVAWSHQLLNLTLGLAVAYPIFSLLVQWGLTGAAGTIGDFEVIPAEARDWLRYATIGGLAISGPLLVASQMLKSAWQRFVAGAFAFAGAGAVAGAGAFAFAGAGALALFFLTEWLGRKLQARLLFLGLYLLALALALFAVLGSAEELADADVTTLLLFLVALPLINALFDFLSIGATRWLLYRGAEEGRWPLLYALGDLLVGLAIFTGLGCATILVIDTLRISGSDGFATGATLIDLPSTLQAIWADPGAYWWLYVTFFSTLLPTVLHVFVAGTALFDGMVRLFAPAAIERLQVAEAKELRREAQLGVWLFAFSQTIGLLLAVCFAAGLIWLLTSESIGVAACLFENVFVEFARLIGAVPADFALRTG